MFDKNITNWRFLLEDIIVLELSSLSLILVFVKLFRFTPNLQTFLSLIIGLIIIAGFIGLILVLAFRENKTLSKFDLLDFELPKLNRFLLFITIFSCYLIRALLKAKSFNEFIYIPSRYNTDIFLYLRRISVFLGNHTAFVHQYNGINAIDILYDSPKLLSSLVYAIFTDIFQNPGIAGTVLTSIILTAIVCKYILLIKNNHSVPKLLYIAVVSFLFFQPSLSWLQDQFYLSNLLYIYLLIYAVEDLLLATEIDNKIFLKFALSAIAIAGFYPSQLPFFALVTIVLLFLTNQQLSHKITHTVKIVTITIAISLIFITQYLATSEVTQHFNLADSQHGVNFIYIPFWSILNLVPKPGGFKVSVGSISLVIASLIIAILVTKYFANKIPTIAKYLYVVLFLYIFYSLSFIIFPGSYRQGKFFVTYIIPLVLFCFVKILQQPKIYQKSIVTGIMILLTIYVGWNSWDRKYKSHLSQDIRQPINYLKEQDRPIAIFYNESDYRYYYISYQLRNSTVSMISHCPSLTELKGDRKLDRLTVIFNDCVKDNIDSTGDNLIQLNL